MPFCFSMYGMSILMFFGSQQWFFLWLVMELSTFSFLSLFFFETLKTENVMLYFIVQSVASFFILFSMLSNDSMLKINQPLMSMMFLLAILMKLGMAPLHTWVMAVVISMKKVMATTMLLLQKVIPFMWLLLFMTPALLLLSFVALLNIIWISPQNMFQYSMKGIIILSSISHSSWLLMSLLSTFTWEIYFIVYSTIMMMIFMVFNTSVKTIFQKNNRTPLFLIFFMLGGVPPLLGFYPKLLVMFNWSESKMLLFVNIILLFSLIDLFIYTRLSMSMTMSTKMTQKWLKGNQLMKMIFLLNLSILALIWF